MALNTLNRIINIVCGTTNHRIRAEQRACIITQYPGLIKTGLFTSNSKTKQNWLSLDVCVGYVEKTNETTVIVDDIFYEILTDLIRERNTPTFKCRNEQETKELISELYNDLMNDEHEVENVDDSFTSTSTMDVVNDVKLSAPIVIPGMESFGTYLVVECNYKGELKIIATSKNGNAGIRSLVNKINSFNKNKSPEDMINTDITPTPIQAPSINQAKNMIANGRHYAGLGTSRSTNVVGTPSRTRKSKPSTKTDFNSVTKAPSFDNTDDAGVSVSFNKTIMSLASEWFGFSKSKVNMHVVEDLLVGYSDVDKEHMHAILEDGSVNMADDIWSILKSNWKTIDIKDDRYRYTQREVKKAADDYIGFKEVMDIEDASERMKRITLNASANINSSKAFNDVASESYDILKNINPRLVNRISIFDRSPRKSDPFGKTVRS